MRTSKLGMGGSATPRVGASLVPEDLLKSITLLDEGHYFQSLAALEHMRRSKRLSECDGLWDAWALLVAAKARFHLEDDASAIECLLAINGGQLAGSRELVVQHASIDGLIRKRRGYRAWKQGHDHVALQDAADALTLFQVAQANAFGDSLKLAFLNARMNAINTEGLIAAISHESQTANPKLVVEAIKTEHEARAWSPPQLRNDITGITVIADLARAANLAISDVFSLGDTPEARAAMLAVLGDATQDWPTLLLNLVRCGGNRPFVNAQALVLGATLMLRPKYEHLLPALGYPYQVNLMDALLSLQKETQRETSQTGKIREAIRNIDKAAKTTFPGRRVFR